MKGTGISMTWLETEISAKREKARPRIQPPIIPQIPIRLAAFLDTIPAIPDTMPVVTIIKMAMDNSCTIELPKLAILQSATCLLEIKRVLFSGYSGRVSLREV
jgi:hypothetical protein